MRPKAPKLVSYKQVAPALPHPIPRRQFLRMADAGKAPPYIRTSFKAEPLFLESAILKFIRDKYFDLIPEFVLRLEKEGLTPSSNDRAV